MGQGEACRAVGMDQRTFKKYSQKRRELFETTKLRKNDYHDKGGLKSAQNLKQGVNANHEVPLPIPLDKLSPEAKKALDDPGYFAERYFGVILMPFQVEWIKKAEESLRNPDQDFILINITTGAGKSTLLVILAAWMIVRERRIRGMFGSGTQNAAEQMLFRLRNALERTVPVKAKWSEVRDGRAMDAEATLIDDFGLFRPPDKKGMWRNDAIQVMLLDGTASTEKEPTWQAYSRKGQVVGNRVEFAIWDDVWRPSELRSMEAREEFLRWWDDEAEERIEPDGTLMLSMQRLGADDLSRYVLDKKVPLEDAPERLVNIFHDNDYSADDLDADGGDQGIPVYQHLCFKAHYDDRCEGEHGKDAKPYPEGCLLYPRRVPWTKVARAKHTNPSKYQLVYQQEDGELPDQLVHPLWISGGLGQDGVEYPGCWDKERSECELPDLKGPLLNIITIDPSPENWWGIIDWTYDCNTEQRFLYDLDRHKLRIDQFLNYDSQTNSFSGLLHDWVMRSRDQGRPVTHVILEANAGQFFFKNINCQRWAQQMGVHLIPHSTNRNKNDVDFGVGMLRDVYRFGKVRLPGSNKGQGRAKCLFLTREVTRYPEKGTTTDLLMSQWFLEYNLPNLIPSIKPLMKLDGIKWTYKKVV